MQTIGYSKTRVVHTKFDVCVFIYTWWEN